MAQSQPVPSDVFYEFEHIQDNRGPEIVVAVCVCLTLAYVAVALRVIARHVSRSKLQADDYWIFITLVSKATIKAHHFVNVCRLIDV